MSTVGGFLAACTALATSCLSQLRVGQELACLSKACLLAGQPQRETYLSMMALEGWPGRTVLQKLVWLQWGLWTLATMEMRPGHELHASRCTAIVYMLCHWGTGCTCTPEPSHPYVTNCCSVFTVVVWSLCRKKVLLRPMRMFPPDFDWLQLAALEGRWPNSTLLGC